MEVRCTLQGPLITQLDNTMRRQKLERAHTIRHLGLLMRSRMITLPLAKKKQQADINILFSRREKYITATLKTIIATVRFPGQSHSTA